MKSFLKRRKSNVGEQAMTGGGGARASPALPTQPPDFARPSPSKSATLSSIEMPDLRFSRMDLEASLAAVGAGSPASMYQRSPKESFGSSLRSQQQHRPDSTRGTSNHLVDKQQLVDSATRAMNIEVPVKAPEKHTASPLGAVTPDTASSRKQQPTREAVERSLRGREQDLREPDASRQPRKPEKSRSRPDLSTARGRKTPEDQERHDGVGSRTVQKRSLSLPRIAQRASPASSRGPSPAMPSGPPPKAPQISQSQHQGQQRSKTQDESFHHVDGPKPQPQARPAQAPRPSSPQSFPILGRQQLSEGPTRRTEPHGTSSEPIGKKAQKVPSGMPSSLATQSTSKVQSSQKPASSKARSQLPAADARPRMSPRGSEAQLGYETRDRHAMPPAREDEPLQSSRKSQVNSRHQDRQVSQQKVSINSQQRAPKSSQPHAQAPPRAASRDVAADTRPRKPIKVTRQPQPAHKSAEEEKGRRPTQEFPSTPSGKPRNLPTTSSSEGGNTTSSTGDGARHSMDSNTSYGSAADDFAYPDAHHSPEHVQRRPRRDTEREERAQSRLSAAMDVELQRNGFADDQSRRHERTDSKTSQHSTFSAMLLASRPGGAGDRSVDATKQPAARKQQEIDTAREMAVMQQYVQRPAREPEAARLTPAQVAQQKTQRAVMAAAAMYRRPEPQVLLRRIRERAPTVQQNERVVRRELIAEGEGWRTRGVGDAQGPETFDKHWRTVKETIQIKRPKATGPESTESNAAPQADGEAKPEDAKPEGAKPEDAKPTEPEFEVIEEKVEAHYNDLFELIWTATTPDVSERMLSHLDIADIRNMRQTSQSVRFAIGTHREIIIKHFLEPIGYRTWSHQKTPAATSRSRYYAQHQQHLQQQQSGMHLLASHDPCPISLDDLEAFLLSPELLPEYPLVARDYIVNKDAMDQAIPQLARASTRAYNRVLTRLRQQPVYKLPSGASDRGVSRSCTTANVTSSPHADRLFGNANRHNSYYPQRKGSAPAEHTMPQLTLSMPRDGAFHVNTIGSPTQDHGSDQGPMVSSPTVMSPVLNSDGSPKMPQVSSPGAMSLPAQNCGSPLLASEAVQSAPSRPALASPWKPGRAALFRVWVPPRDPSGWLSDDELASCELELYNSGVWNFMKRGDVVWDVAVPDSMNDGKYIFDGHYLRDLSYAYDVVGHLPAWLNAVVFCPSYWHNIIKASTPQPVVHFDISPWRDQILNSLRLVQDHVETMGAGGARYRVAKWLYRSAANVASGQIISKMNSGLEVVDEGWKGRIVIEMEGTAESAKLLIERCAGPEAAPADKAALLARVMGDAQAARNMMNTFDTNGLFPAPQQQKGNAAAGGAATLRGEVQTSPWAIMRERSRPGLIWLRPLSARQRLVA